MKQWSEPSMKELNISSTEYHATEGTVQDGAYISYDGKYYIPTYSGPYSSDSPIKYPDQQ